MKERLIKSYKENAKQALHWAKVAVDDIGKWKDETVCIESLSFAYSHAGQAKLSALILKAEYGDEEYILDVSDNVFNKVDQARQRVTNSFKTNH